MKNRLQRGAVERSYPRWVRLLALLCLLLVAGASTAQAAHIHGQWLPHKALHASEPAGPAQTAGGEEHCALCMAMHAALPVSLRLEAVQVALIACVPVEVDDRIAESSWHFAMFSRPPPATQTLQQA